MKVDVGKARSAIERTPGAIRLILCHGSDEATGYDLAERLGAALGPNAERFDCDGPMLKANPGLLADEAASSSLFGDRRWIRAAPVGEDALEAITLLMASDAATNPVIAIAPGVKTSGKLVKLALAERGVMAVTCYKPDGEKAAGLAAQVAREAGVRLAPGTAQRLAEAAGGDRAVLAREVEKIALYLDAAPDRPGDCDDAVLDAIGAAVEEDGMFDAIAAVIEGDPVTTGQEVRAMAADASAVPMLRQLGRQLVQLAEMRVAVDGGEPIDRVVAGVRNFRQKDAMARALRRWSAPHLARAVDRVRAAELAVVAPDNAGGVLGWDEAVAIARAAQRWA